MAAVADADALEQDVVVAGPRGRMATLGEAGAREARTLVKASVSSGAATAVDGVIYQALLFLMPSYALAAFGGAVLGAVTNFALNRTWVFPHTTKGLKRQAMQYAMAAAATYVGLQLSLFMLIEVLAVPTRVAWVPAKVIAWLLVSYPMQRLVVFAEKRTNRAVG